MFIDRTGVVKLMATFPRKDYSKQLAEVKKRYGDKLKCHPDYNPAEHPNHFMPWQMKSFNK